MTFKALFIIATLGLLSLSAIGQQSYYGNQRVRYDRGGTLFFPNEFSVDLFGIYTDHDRFGTASDTWGGGLGLNYFITRYVGVMADTYIEDWHWPYLANASLALRVPVDHLNLAPYAFGGAGRQWKYVPQWTTHVGGGLEFRFNPKAGIFADGRRVFADETKDSTLVRFGLRLGF